MLFEWPFLEHNLKFKSGSLISIPDNQVDRYELDEWLLGTELEEFNDPRARP